MSEDSLVNYQTKAYEQVVAEYTFECSGGGAEPVVSPPLKGLKKGVKLHFFRYAFFEKESKSDRGMTLETIQNSETSISIEEVIITNDAIPDTENFYLSRSFLRPGYLYIINKNDNGKYKEYEVNASGQLTGIVWYANNNGDQRKANGDARYFITLNEAGEYYIAYSPVQWSRAYFDEINNDDAKKAEVMQLFNCIGIPYGSTPESDEVIAYKDIKLSFNTGDHRYQKIHKTIRQIHKEEEKQTEAGDNEFYEDMLLTLDDPTGCSQDISKVLAKKINDFKALTEAIQTGEREEDALNRLITNKEAPETPKEYRDLFSLALACYKMVYSNKKNTRNYDGGLEIGWSSNDTNFPYQPEKEATYRYQFNPYSKFSGVTKIQTNNYVPNEMIGSGLHREKVEGILGVHARREKKAIVNTFRDIYGNFIQTEYYNSGLKFYKKEYPEQCVFGIADLFEELILLYNNPDNIDRHLLLDAKNSLEKDVYHETDKWIDWVNACKNEECPDPNNVLGSLIAHELTVSQKVLNNWVDLSNKFAAVVNAKLGLYALDSTFFKSKKVEVKMTGKTNYQKIVDEGYEKIVDRINKISIKKTDSGEVVKAFSYGNTHGIQVDARVFGVTAFDPNLHVVIEGPGGEIIDKFKAESFGHERLYGKTASEAGGSHRYTVGDQVENTSKKVYTENLINESSAKRFNQKAFDVLNSRGFTGALTALQIVNFHQAVLNIFSDDNTKFQHYLKDGANAVGIAAELTEASLLLTRSHLKSINSPFLVNNSRLISNTIKVAGAIGGGITSAMCIWDGVIAFNNKDNDAGAAWIGAGVAFGVSTAAGLWGSSVLLLSGPVGWIALGIGFILVTLAYIFTDSELEKYFKHFLLSDTKAFPLNGRTPMKYNRDLFIAKNTLIDGSDKDIIKTMMYPADAMATLHDLTICHEIKYFIPKKGTHKARDGHTEIDRLAIEIVFNNFLAKAEQVEAQGILMHATDGNNKPFELEVINPVVTALKGGQKKFAAVVKLPEEKHDKINYRTQLVLALRIGMDKANNHYFPFPYESEGMEPRYIGARFMLHLTNSHNLQETKEEDIVFDTIGKLSLEKTW